MPGEKSQNQFSAALSNRFRYRGKRRGPVHGAHCCIIEQLIARFCHDPDTDNFTCLFYLDLNYGLEAVYSLFVYQPPFALDLLCDLERIHVDQLICRGTSFRASVRAPLSGPPGSSLDYAAWRPVSHFFTSRLVLCRGLMDRNFGLRRRRDVAPMESTTRLSQRKFRLEAAAPSR